MCTACVKRYCEGLLSLTADLFSGGGDPLWRQRFLKGLKRLVPYEFAGCHVLDPSKGVVCEAVYEPAKPSLPLENKDFWRIIRRHPLNPVLFNRLRESWRISDVVSRCRFRQTEVFEVLYKPFGVDCEISAAVPFDGGSGQVLLLSLHRAVKDFSQRDRILLNLLLPHVARLASDSILGGRSGGDTALDFDHFVRSVQRGAPWKLTARETEVLYWLQLGKTNGEIGQILGISERTAETHALRSYPKLGVENF